MKLSSIVVVVFRIYAINWFLQGFIMAIRVAAPPQSGAVSHWSFVMPAAAIFAGFLCWYLAAPLSRLVTRGYESELNLGTSTREDLYALAFLLAGLYFSVRNLGPAFNWLHYLLSSTEEQRIAQHSSFYDAAEPFMTFAAGVFLLFCSHQCARKLNRFQNESA